MFGLLVVGLVGFSVSSRDVGLVGRVGGDDVIGLGRQTQKREGAVELY